MARPKFGAPPRAQLPATYRVNAIFQDDSRPPATTGARSLLELQLLQAVGAVLDKPRWWCKWQKPEVRAKWLAEIEHGFVERSFAAIFKWWPQVMDRSALLREMRAAVAIPGATGSAEERARLLDVACSRVAYRRMWGDRSVREEKAYNASRDTAYAAALALLAERGVVPRDAALPKLDPYGQLGWYVHQWSRIQRVRAVGAANLTEEAVREIFGRDADMLEQRMRMLWHERDALYIARHGTLDGDEVTNPGDLREDENEDVSGSGSDSDGGRDEHLSAARKRRAFQRETQLLRESQVRRVDLRDAVTMADVVLAMRDQAAWSIDSFCDVLGNPEEAREDVLSELLQYVALIHVELNAVRDFVVAYVNQVQLRCGLQLNEREQGSNPDEITWGAVEGTFVSDTLISEELQNTFLDQVHVLEDVPADLLDWHPRSNGQVLDLVHPSLYVGVFRDRFGGLLYSSKRVAETSTAEIEGIEDVASQLLPLLIHTDMDNERLERPSRRSGVSFQWLPTEFEVSDSGHASRIRSYINNLHPADHRDMYDSIAAIFGCFVPLFERVLTSLKGPTPEVLVVVGNMDRRNYDELPVRPEVPSDVQLQRSTVSPVSLAGAKLQVIVKIAEIVLTPEKPAYSGGSWHIEGTEVEQIVATGIYYFSSKNVSDAKLAFRTTVDAPDYSQSDDLGVGVTYDLSNNNFLAQPLGAVTTPEGRCLVFPNVLQHQVQPFELLDKTKRGVRKILCFFLVDPSRRIPSTAVVAPQQHDWIKRARLEQLQHTPLSHYRVPETVQEQIRHLAFAPGLTLEMAKKFRRELMYQRSSERLFSKDEREDLYFSLCEH